MTDKELLEWSAKAADLSIMEFEEGGTVFAARLFPSGYIRWNPLRADGDALQLVVALGLVVAVMDDFTACYTFKGGERADEKHNDDKSAATRRAIVRAAAEIGKKS